MCLMINFDNYYIAEFKSSKTVECAPRKWISYDASKCQWPCVANVLPLQRKGVDPETMPDVVWDVHDIRILHHHKGYDDFNTAKEALRKFAESLSDWNTDDLSLTGKKSRKNRARKDAFDDGWAPPQKKSQHIPRPPTIKRVVKTAPSKNSGNRNISKGASSLVKITNTGGTSVDTVPGSGPSSSSHPKSGHSAVSAGKPGPPSVNTVPKPGTSKSNTSAVAGPQSIPQGDAPETHRKSSPSPSINLKDLGLFKPSVQAKGLKHNIFEPLKNLSSSISSLAGTSSDLMESIINNDGDDNFDIGSEAEDLGEGDVDLVDLTEDCEQEVNQEEEESGESFGDEITVKEEHVDGADTTAKSLLRNPPPKRRSLDDLLESKDFGEVLRIIVTNQRSILRSVKNLSQRFDSLSLKVNPNLSKPPDGWPEKTPLLQTKVAFHHWEKRLHSESFQLYAVNYLLMAGGDDPPAMTRKSMAKIFSQDLRAYLGWEGSERKDGVKGSKTVKLILTSVRRRFQTATESEVYPHIKQWLRQPIPSKPKKSSST